MFPTNPGEAIKGYWGSVTPMESKQPPEQEENNFPVIPAKTVNEISGQLADIELKLDHIIETIKDSLHRMNLESREDVQ